jgi:DNA repair protein RadD
MKQEFELREYQIESVEGLRNLIRQGVRNMILSVPTGGGKTVIAAYLTAECHGKPGKRAVFVADRIALIDQTSETFDRYGIPHGIIQGNNPRCKPWERIQVASAQTIAKRGWPDADLIIVDECHAMQATVAARLAGRDTIVIGLTATPMTRGLGALYDGIVTVITTNQLIAAGFLVPFRVYAASEPDMTGAKTVAGEWTDAAAEERAMPIVGDCVEEYLRHAAGKKFIAFGCSVEHCEEIQRQFAAAGVVSELYTYRTEDTARAALVEEFRKPDSSVRGLISVSALSKGFDVSDVECIIMARPLRSSLAEHIQILGRGLRIHPGKTECIVLDHSGNCVRFWGAMHDFLEGGVTELDDGKKKAKPKARDKAEKKPVKCPTCFQVHDPMPACPSCGHVYKKSSVVEQVAGTLSEMKGGKQANAPISPALKMKFYGQLRQYAADKQKSEKWILAKYQEKFSEWPGRKDVPLEQPTPETLKWIQYSNIRRAKSFRAAHA